MYRKPLQLFSPDDTGGAAPATEPQAGEETGTPVEPQAGEPAAPTPQAGATTPAEPQAGEPQQAPQQKPSRSAEDLEREVEKLRKESAGYRTRLKTFEDEEKKRQEAELSEKERLQKNLTDLQAQHDELTKAQTELAISYEVRLAALELGIKPDRLSKVERLVEWEDIEVDTESGKPTNVKAVLEQLIKEMPELVPPAQPARQAPTTSGGATNPPRSTVTNRLPEKITAEFVASLTPEKYAHFTDEERDRLAKANVNRYLR